MPDPTIPPPTITTSADFVTGLPTLASYASGTYLRPGNHTPIRVVFLLCGKGATLGCQLLVAPPGRVS